MSSTEGPRKPDRRWPPLEADLSTALEFWRADFVELAGLERDLGGKWPDRVAQALGCLEGARALLHDARIERAAFLALLEMESGQPPKH